MNLRQVYTQFLSAPSTAPLADGATINYVPTLTSISEPASIIKHLAAQAKVLKKKKESVISAVESENSISLEVDTTIEFVAGGGAYLPGLDDNFLADRVVQFPVIHVVQFNAQQQILQIRLYWDQGSILKGIEVIGSRGRNWPIRDGQDQLRLIASSASVDVGESNSSHRSTTSQESNQVNRSHTSSVSATSDPHASLSLFQPREVADDSTPRKNSTGVAPRMSAKPPSRNLADILTGKEDEYAPGSPSDRPSSPKKNGEGAPKMGAGKNYHPIRLFDSNIPEEPNSPEKSAVKTHPKKFKHFEFGNGEGAVQGNVRSRAKHESQWDFADFATPSKPAPKIQPQNARHFGWSDDEEEARKSPVHREIVHHERPTNQPHFQFTDDATPAKEQKRPTSQHKNNNMGLYTDNVTDSTPNSKLGKSQPLSTNPNISNRTKDFGPHFDMTDKSPANEVPEARKKDDNQEQVIKGMGANWSMYDESPASKKENRGIRLGGNGMGGRKETSANWAFGGDEENEAPGAGRKNVSAATQQVDASSTAKKQDRGIKLGGNGMGGRKGISANWAFGGDDEEDENNDAQQQRASHKPIAPKTATAGTVSNQKSSFWEF